MSKVPIDIDDDLLELARQELGTTTKKDTVNEALRIVVIRRKRLRTLADGSEDDGNPYAHLGLGADITNPEIMKDARR